MTNAELTAFARNVASRLSTKASFDEAKAKSALLELAHRLDLADVRARNLGLQLRDGLGRTRRATWRESLAYWLTGSLPGRL